MSAPIKPPSGLSQAVLPTGLTRVITATDVVNSHYRDTQQAIIGDRIIRLKTVLARTGLSRSTIYRKIADGSFPRQLAIGTNSAGWRESAINKWIEDPTGWHDPDREGKLLRKRRVTRGPGKSALE